METPKGMHDHSPAEQRTREFVIDTIRNVFTTHGFHPLSTPSLEKWTTLSHKHAGGDEILKETYRLQDQGGRDLGLRYDLTVPLARYISQHPTVKLPFKRYQIGPVFRDGPVKQGRLREFHQADADIVGTESTEADQTCIQLLLDVFDRLDLDITVQINHRSILQRLTEHVGIDDFETAVLILDKTEKKPRKALLDEAEEKGIDRDAFADLLDQTQTGLDDIDTHEIDQLQNKIDDASITITPRLARGLTYYTGTIYEVFTDGYEHALASGGRYDQMIGRFTQRGEYPAVGVSFGIEPITACLPERHHDIDAFILPIGEREAARDLAQELRTELNVDLDVTDRGVSAGLDYADHHNIPYVILVGEDELQNGYYTVKNMGTGEEDEVPQDEITTYLSNLS